MPRAATKASAASIRTTQVGSVPYGDFLPLFLSPFFAVLLLIRPQAVRNDSHCALISVCVPLLSFSFGGSKPLFGGSKLSFGGVKPSFGGSKQWHEKKRTAA